ncbi:MAG: hypothetical protein FJZ01_01570 [Candidatus Sericytochromatia bacterium]|nr:hypothetical protein [Candidatus Tanganyikabacteria bacterium]
MSAPPIGAIPAQLRAESRWVTWRVEQRQGKRTKVPLNRDGHMASVTDAGNWRSFEEVVDEADRDDRLDGIGFVLGDGWAGVDLDDCRDPATGTLAPEAMEIVRRCNSYCEVSPSGEGVKLFLRATKPGTRAKKTAPAPGIGAIEIYDRSRYFTVTGRHLPGTPTTIEARQTELEALYRELLGTPRGRSSGDHAGASASSGRPGRPLMPRWRPSTDDELIERARNARNGGAFSALWNGDTSSHGSDDSAADLALCNHLAYWTDGDADRIDRLFRQSGLMREKWDRDGYRERTIARAIESLRPDSRNGASHAPRDAGSGTGAAEIRIGVGQGELARMADDGESALLACERPVFQRGGMLVTIRRDGARELASLTRAPGEPAIVPLSEASLREELDRVACWLTAKTDKNTGEVTWNPARVPDQVVRTLHARATWRLRPLEAIVEAPYLRPDGSLVTTPGWDCQTGIWFEPPAGVVFPRMPDHPSRSDALAALDLLQEAICDFPFVAEHHRAAALAGILTPILRTAIPGPCPAFCISANSPGTGKGLLAGLSGSIALGRSPAVMPPTRDADEQRKQITTIAMAGSPLVVLDNLTEPLGGSVLDAALTAESWRGRVLGANREWSGPLRAVWYVTGNNLRFRGDFTRRAIPIELRTALERPDERPETEFRHPDLMAWVREHRPALVAAVLTIARAYFAEGLPPQGLAPIGGFEGWSRVARNALVWLGLPDPAAGRQEVRATADPDLMAFSAVSQAWHAAIGERFVTLAELVREIRDASTSAMLALRDALDAFAGDNHGGVSTKGLGRRIAPYKNRPIGGLRLEAGDPDRTRAGTWRMIRLAEPILISEI